MLPSLRPLLQCSIYSRHPRARVHLTSRAEGPLSGRVSGRLRVVLPLGAGFSVSCASGRRGGATALTLPLAERPCSYRVLPITEIFCQGAGSLLLLPRVLCEGPQRDHRPRQPGGRQRPRTEGTLVENVETRCPRPPHGCRTAMSGQRRRGPTPACICPSGQPMTGPSSGPARGRSVAAWGTEPAHLGLGSRSTKRLVLVALAHEAESCRCRNWFEGEWCTAVAVWIRRRPAPVLAGVGCAGPHRLGNRASSRRRRPSPEPAHR